MVDLESQRKFSSAYRFGHSSSDRGLQEPLGEADRSAPLVRGTSEGAEEDRRPGESSAGETESTEPHIACYFFLLFFFFFSTFQALNRA